MAGGHLAAEGGVEAAAGVLQWRLAGIGHFNGDGWADALLLRDDGLLRINTTNSQLVTNSHVLGQLEAKWSIVGINDVNNDGTTDVLLRNENGVYQAELIQNHSVAAVIDILPQNDWMLTLGGRL